MLYCVYCVHCGYHSTFPPHHYISPFPITLPRVGLTRGELTFPLRKPSPNSTSILGHPPVYALLSTLPWNYVELSSKLTPTPPPLLHPLVSISSAHRNLVRNKIQACSPLILPGTSLQQHYGPSRQRQEAVSHLLPHQLPTLHLPPPLPTPATPHHPTPITSARRLRP